VYVHVRTGQYTAADPPRETSHGQGDAPMNGLELVLLALVARVPDGRTAHPARRGGDA
jgi:hypothetical protein